MAGLALVLTLAAFADPNTPPEAPQETPASRAPSTAPSPAEEPIVLEDVEIQGRRGAALVDPESELDGAQIDALGADDIGEVLRRLTEDYGLGEAPMIIVNGRRVADPGVFSGFPPDALVRVEVLPPEAGGLYGAESPSRRVVNIVLPRRFDSRDGRASLRRPTAGGLSNLSLDVRQSSIIEARTRQLGLQADIDTALRAGDRDRDEPDAVTLRPATETLSANLAQTTPLGDWAASLRIDARSRETRSVALRGDETVENTRRSQSLAATAGLNGDVADWSVQLLLNGSLSQSSQAGLTASDGDQRAIMASLGIGRPLIELPAGLATVKLTARTLRTRSTTEAAGLRRTFSGRSDSLNGNLNVPLARRDASGGLLGDMTLTLGGGLNETDTGRSEGWSTALSWSPTSKLNLNGSWSNSTQSLQDQQRFEPEYYGEPITVFDFQMGEAVQVLPLLGGNPDLRPPSNRQLAASISAGPFTSWALQGRVSLLRSQEVDGVGVLPDPTPEVEAAFPERFRRDADGRLVSIDQRPLNLGGTLMETLSSGLNFKLPSPAGGARTDIVRIALNHTWRLRNTVAVNANLPEMDRLAGDGGGVSRHTFGIQADARRGRWGVNLGARWRDGYRIRRDIGRDGPGDLRIGSFSTVDLGLSVQFARDLPTRSESAARRGVGLQVELDIDNLFDARPRARLGDGRPGPGYGRDDQDPVGRMVRITLKQRF